jgi:hypothetical protein
MNALGFFVASLTAGGLSVAMISGTSPKAMAGSSKYESLRKRRTFGWVVLVSAVLLLIIALLQLMIQG